MKRNEITAEILRKVCKALGLKTYQLAERLDMGKQQMYDYTSGKFPPKWEFWNLLLTTFPELSAEYLLTGKGDILKV